MNEMTYPGHWHRQRLDPAPANGNRPRPAPIAESATIGSLPNERESLSENFNREIDAWARQALGANGFGDGP